MRTLLLPLVCGLAACGEGRSFDEQYEDTAANLEAKAERLDNQAQADLESSAEQSSNGVRSTR
jgi:hypothetical protein